MEVGGEENSLVCYIYGNFLGMVRIVNILVLENDRDFL